jgi:ribA/ribD-fused uncharacterized protein
MAIDKFEGENRFLSNFWLCDIYDTEDEEVYRSVEHIFQAKKTLDKKERKAIRECATPGQAKKMGKTVTLRADWEQVKIPYMKTFVKQKFVIHRDLLEKLLATGDEELIEGNTWGDDFWGVCNNGIGQNNLGKILMEVRDELRLEEAQDN